MRHRVAILGGRGCGGTELLRLRLRHPAEQVEAAARVYEEVIRRYLSEG